MLQLYVCVQRSRRSDSCRLRLPAAVHLQGPSPSNRVFLLCECDRSAESAKEGCIHAHVHRFNTGADRDKQFDWRLLGSIATSYAFSAMRLAGLLTS